jgi:AcrR family transcriptional regulator
MSEPRLNKRQLQAAATSERMLVAAREVFESHGYQAASVGLITKQAECAHGTFYLYFQNKDDAFVQVLAGVREEIRAESRAGISDDRYEGVVGAIRGFLVVFLEHRGLMRALLEGMMLSPRIEGAWREMRHVFTDRIAHRLEREQAAGAVRTLDTHAAAHALASMAEWHAFTHLVLGDDGPPATAAELDETIATLADLWYHAVYGVVPT